MFTEVIKCHAEFISVSLAIYNQILKRVQDDNYLNNRPAMNNVKKIFGSFIYNCAQIE